MAEVIAGVGIVANFAGVIGAGLALSKTLYDFAHVLGSASEDVSSLATDISLFCAVLRQVQNTLTRAKAYRLSMSAIDTAQAIIDRCKIVFDDLVTAVTKLQGGKSRPDFMTRVKWYFKEKRVLLIHEQLKTCGATLHLMLTTLQLAQRIAGDRNSVTIEDDEDSQDRRMASSLCMAEASALERLKSAESQLSCDRQSPDDPTSPIVSRPHSPTEPRLRHRRNRSSHIVNDSIQSVATTPFDEARPVSAILEGHISRLSHVQSVYSSQSSMLDERRLSILQTDELLRQWTDQTDPLAAHVSETDFEASDTPNIRETTALNPYDTNSESGTSLPEQARTLHSSTDLSPDSRNLDTNLEATPTDPPEDTVIPIRSIQLWHSQGKCIQAIPILLQKYQVVGDWTTWALTMRDALEAFEVPYDEYPLLVVQESERRGSKPIIELRKRSVPILWSDAIESTAVKAYRMKERLDLLGDLEVMTLKRRGGIAG